MKKPFIFMSLQQVDYFTVKIPLGGAGFIHIPATPLFASISF
jgi:hypothetical protein